MKALRLSGLAGRRSCATLGPYRALHTTNFIGGYDFLNLQDVLKISGLLFRAMIQDKVTEQKSTLLPDSPVQRVQIINSFYIAIQRSNSSSVAST